LRLPRIIWLVNTGGLPPAILLDNIHRKRNDSTYPENERGHGAILLKEEAKTMTFSVDEMIYQRGGDEDW
jgi:hypothetical protein